MSFDYTKFGKVTSDAKSRNDSLCISGQLDDDKQFGVIHRSSVLSFFAQTGVTNPTQAELDFAAAMFVFVGLGLTRSQATAREEAGKYIVEWKNSASEIFKQESDPLWNVPIAIVVFSREW